MSDSDSFIEEVTEEVRRDRLFGLFRRYGWIPALAIVLLVGGAAVNEYLKAQERGRAERLGDAILVALENDDAAARQTALQEITAETPGGNAILALLLAGQASEAGASQDAVAQLEAIATDGDLPEIYRNIAGFKALLAGADSMDEATRRAGFEGLAIAGNPLRPLAEEQLALMDLAAGATDAALDRLNRLVEDAEASTGLRARATQLIVALGGTVTSP